LPWANPLKELALRKTRDGSLRGFQEAAGEEEREVKIGSLSSGSYEAFLPLGIVAAAMLSKTIDKILDWYLRVLEIRKRREELQTLGAPVAEAAAIKKHERELLDKEIKSLAASLVKETPLKVDAARRNELETHLTVSIRQIARFVDKGGTVEVDATAPVEPDEPEAPEEGAPAEAAEEYGRLRKEFDQLASQVAKMSLILQGGSALKRLPERTEPILQLTDGEGGDEPVDSEKTKKKN
jgi:hypothetical protein